MAVPDSIVTKGAVLIVTSHIATETPLKMLLVDVTVETVAYQLLDNPDGKVYRLFKGSFTKHFNIVEALKVPKYHQQKSKD